MVTHSYDPNIQKDLLVKVSWLHSEILFQNNKQGGRVGRKKGGGNKGITLGS